MIPSRRRQGRERDQDGTWHPRLTRNRRVVAYLDDLQARVDCFKALHTQTQAELDALLPSILDKAFNGEL